MILTSYDTYLFKSIMEHDHPPTESSSPPSPPSHRILPLAHWAARRQHLGILALLSNARHSKLRSSHRAGVKRSALNRWRESYLLHLSLSLYHSRATAQAFRRWKLALILNKISKSQNMNLQRIQFKRFKVYAERRKLKRNVFAACKRYHWKRLQRLAVSRLRYFVVIQ